ncbi:MAG: aminotransferase class V-fold PLP-dependent enzyme [Ginsengibacter sp.]
MNFHSLFPVLDKYTYLNTAYSGLLSVDTAEWRANHDKEFVMGASEFREKSARIIDELRKNISDLFVAQKENTFLVPNFSFGFEAVLNNLNRPHRFLLLKDDYPSIIDPLARRGFEYHEVLIDENMESNILKKIKNYQLTVFAFSMVQYISGFRMDDRFLQKLKEENPDMLLIADGTQFLGTTNFNFSASPLDALIGSGYKWLLGGYGNGYVFLSDQLKEEINKYSKNRDKSALSDPNKNILKPLFEPGHLDSLNFGSLNHSLNFLRTLDMDFIEKTNAELCSAARSDFHSRGLIPDWMCARKNRSTIINLPLDDKTIDKINEAGILSARRGKGLRISFHFYNTFEDLNRLLEVLG